jgi:hypothetical protein
MERQERKQKNMRELDEQRALRAQLEAQEALLNQQQAK